MREQAAEYPQREVLEALGAMVVSFSALEEALKAAIALLADEKVVLADVLTTGMNFSAPIERFGAAYYEYYPNPSARERVHGLCGQIIQLNGERNTLVHSLWIVDRNTGGWRRQKAAAHSRHGLRYSMTDIKPEAVWDLVSRLEAAKEAVIDLALSSKHPTS